MSEPVSLFDRVDEDSEMRAVSRARAEIEAGYGVPHERVREWLATLAEGEIIPPPAA